MLRLRRDLAPNVKERPREEQPAPEAVDGLARWRTRTAMLVPPPDFDQFIAIMSRHRR